MKIFLERIIFHNRAPFEQLDIALEENDIAVLTAANGKGKTTVISHIVDAIYEITKGNFGNQNDKFNDNFYRVGSSTDFLDINSFSLVYLRFSFGIKKIDYVNINGLCRKEEYESLINLDNKIPFEEIETFLKEQKYLKYISKSSLKTDIVQMFDKNIITYFPAYRYELPAFLNDIYKYSSEFNIDFEKNGFLKNPIEVVTGLKEFANWILDVILDAQLGYNQVSNIKRYPDGYQYVEINNEISIINNLETILTNTLQSKINSQLRFGIGPRNNGGVRVQVFDKVRNIPIYPSIHGLSSGESSMLMIFGEILRQADKLKNNTSLNEIKGIVFIDEVDKHLHIKLQKEILPKMFMLFPNIQFIISSHSPFLNIGLAEQTKSRSKIIDLNNAGVITNAESNDLYLEVYNMMIDENERFKSKFEDLNKFIDKNSKDYKTLIITEGKTDTYHLKAAFTRLNFSHLKIEFYEINEDWGDSRLKSMLEHLSKIPQKQKVIGIFDRDDQIIVKYIEELDKPFKSLGNNVFAMCIPPVNVDVYGQEISIEHYYPIELLLKKDSNGRRIFLGNEFYESGNSTDGKFQTKISNIKHKVKVNGIIDEKVFNKEDLKQNQNIALSKMNFANLVNNQDFANDLDFKEFVNIFQKIEEIINM